MHARSFLKFKLPICNLKGVNTMIDFRKKLSQTTIEPKSNPIEIYNTLDRKSVTGFLRPVQENILEKWYTSYKDKKDLIIKLHTGEGKTLIGLLILQSHINQNHSPSLYICANRHLVEQVCEEAEKFGIAHCKLLDGNGIPNEFSSGQKILITHAQKVFNGKSVFGLGNKSIEATTVILDDSHECIDTLKRAYTITIKKNNNEKLYDSFLGLFEDSLRDQREGSFIDIKNGEYDTLMAVPYWEWTKKKTEVLDLLSSHRGDRQILFAWSLLRDSIEKCECYITGTKIEIFPYSTNIEQFGTFANAKHRILMSATTQDDAFFIKGLDFDLDAVKFPLKGDLKKWSGEKMLIIPSLIHDSCERDLIIAEFSKLKHEKFGIVSIVPNTKKAKQYKTLGATIGDKSNMVNELSNLKKGIFNNIFVINNRYDGIDLPDEACRILIVDSMPYFENLSDRYEESCRPNSESVNKKLAQKIEQGIGRGVRGEKDYCVLLIIGADIAKFMHNNGSKKYFSAQTQKQIDIGLCIEQMTKENLMADTRPIETIISVIYQSINRDEAWKAYYSSQMNTVKNVDEVSTIYDQLHEERKIEKLYYDDEIEKACDTMKTFIDNLPSDNNLEKGWYLQQLARYTYSISTIESDELQKVAFKLNSSLIKPRFPITYLQISYLDQNKLEQIKSYLAKFSSYDELRLAIDDVLTNLAFGVSSDKFEEALKEIGELLGFISERPDKENRRGPDNLWCGKDDQYFMFECKNQVDINRLEIKKTEASQMNSHCAWFENIYGKNRLITRFLIIPTKTLSYSADFTHDVRIIRKEKLRNFKINIRNFINELSPYYLKGISEKTLQGFIESHKLDIDDIVSYSENSLKKF